MSRVYYATFQRSQGPCEPPTGDGWELQTVAAGSDGTCAESGGLWLVWTKRARDPKPAPTHEVEW